MDFDLPFQLDISAPCGDTAVSIAGPVVSYHISVEEKDGQVVVELERRFARGPGSGIAILLGRATAAADGWPRWAPELVLDVTEAYSEHPALIAGVALVLDRPDLVVWTPELREAALEWGDDRVRAAAIAHLRQIS